MNLDELQSVQARERQSSDLQHLRASFYREVGEFISDLTAQRAEAVAGAEDPFSAPEVRRLSDDIETAEQTVEAIYERRVGKVVKKASIAAADMPVDAEGLTDEEADLFDDLVERIERNRETVLATLDGAAPSASPAPEDRPSDADAVAAAGDSPASAAVDSADDGSPAGVSAADLMGEGGDDAETAAGRDTEADHSQATAPGEPPAPDPNDGGPAAPPGPPAGDESGPDEEAASTGAPAAADAESEAEDVPGLPRTTVRITAEVGEVVGADDRDYDLSVEDVVTLPEPNADVLVDKDAAERLE